MQPDLTRTLYHDAIPDPADHEPAPVTDLTQRIERNKREQEAQAALYGPDDDTPEAA